MQYGIDSIQMISLDRVFLDSENPRHLVLEGQNSVIEYLCTNEQVLPLAKDIAKNGLNPLELFALLEEGSSSYVSAEGNRRLCALMLLNDPERAPQGQRDEFERAAEDWIPISQVSGIVFESREEVRLWLDRIHAGVAGGKGRRQWNAEQKARNSGYSKNVQAQELLDAAQKLGMITAEERKGRLSTVQRYVGNPIMRNALGIDFSDVKNPTTNLSETDFRIVLETFMGDVAAKRVTTRANAEEIQAYSNKLNGLEEVSGERIERHPISEIIESNRSSDSSQPVVPPKPRTNIKMSISLREAFEDIPSYKLEKLYYSLCKVRLNSHTPLLCVGAWCLTECLTALHGRSIGTSFHSYLSAQKLQKMGLGSRTETNSMRQAIKRIEEFGNSTKHHRTAGGFNGEQLFNDMQTIEPLLLCLAKEAKGKS